MPRVLISAMTIQQQPGEYRRILESAGFTIRYLDRPDHQPSAEEMTAYLDGIDAVLAGSEPYPAWLLEKFGSLRVISRVGVGTDAVDVAACSRLGIAVGFTPGANHAAVVELALALMLALAKRIIPAHADITAGGFHRVLTRPLRGQVLGIVGFGRIGRHFAETASMLGMQVLIHDPMMPTDFVCPPSVRMVELETLLRESDWVSLHAPASPATHHLISRETLGWMKPTACLLNTARGSLVDEAALAEALREGRLAGAGLDVFELEPPTGSPILSAPNVVLTPHVAGTDHESISAMATMGAQTIVDAYQGRFPTERLVNASALGVSWRW